MVGCVRWTTNACTLIRVPDGGSLPPAYIRATRLEIDFVDAPEIRFQSLIGPHFALMTHFLRFSPSRAFTTVTAVI